jgi:hypothetical protein
VKIMRMRMIPTILIIDDDYSGTKDKAETIQSPSGQYRIKKRKLPTPISTDSCQLQIMT